MPERIQRRRVKGWRMPEGAVYVGRPSKWGNPYRADDYPKYPLRQYPDGEWREAEDMRRIPDATLHRWAVVDFRAAVVDGRAGWVHGYPYVDEIRAELAGRDLACWCPLEDERGNRFPCHADVLLELANGAPDA